MFKQLKKPEFGYIDVVNQFMRGRINMSEATQLTKILNIENAFPGMFETLAYEIAHEGKLGSRQWKVKESMLIRNREQIIQQLTALGKR